MGGPFVITLREAFEAALILGIVYGYLDQVGARRQFRLVTAGAALGIVASAALGVVVTVFSGPLVDLGPDVIAVAVLLGAAALLTWHGWWMRRSGGAIRGDVERRILDARAAKRLWVVALIAFTAVFREGAETVLFLWGLTAQAAEGGGWASAAGAVAGILAATALGWLVFRGGRRISVRHFFAATAVLIVLLTAGLVASAVGRLAGMGLLPQTETVWDTSAWLTDGSLLGTVLGGLVGYRARPSLLEVGAYAAYLVVGGWLVLGWRRGRTLAPMSPTPRGRVPAS